MSIQINQKIKGYSVVKPHQEPSESPVVKAPEVSVTHMNEAIERPEMLIGSTYKIKAPVLDHALYVTINDIILNEGTPHEERRPFEVFINSKAMDQFQWIVALTRIMSAVFRKGGDVKFLVEEMKAVFDPHGGYFKPGGVFMPSLVAEIGSVIERHLKFIGLIEAPELSEAQKKLIAEKRAALESAKTQASSGSEQVGSRDASGFPPEAKMCGKCHTKALVILDGCQTCLNCGDSKCG